MTKKIFKSTVLVSAMILILGSALVMGILYRYFGKQLDGELEKEASYLAYGVEQNGVNYLEHLKQKDARMTYIDASGNVLYDSQADISSMENHSDRKEFEEAVQKGHGYTERMSSTLSERRFIMRGSLQTERFSEWLQYILLYWHLCFSSFLL